MAIVIVSGQHGEELCQKLNVKGPSQKPKNVYSIGVFCGKSNIDKNKKWAQPLGVHVTAGYKKITEFSIKNIKEAFQQQ